MLIHRILKFFIGVFIVAAKRTPFGTMGGMFVNKSATDLSIVASTAAIQAANLKPEKIDSVIFGHVLVVSVVHVTTIDNYESFCNSYELTYL